LLAVHAFVAAKPDTSQTTAICRRGVVCVEKSQGEWQPLDGDTRLIRRIERRYVAAILLRRITGVTVLCDESSELGRTPSAAGGATAAFDRPGLVPWK
jgi:hypothetical protein